MSAVQEEFLPQLVPASPLPTFPRHGKPSRKLTHCLLLPRLGAGPGCLQHQRAAPFMDAGIAHCSDPPAPACPGCPLPEPSTLLTGREQPRILVLVLAAAGLRRGLGARWVADIAAKHTISTTVPGLGKEAAPRLGGRSGGLMGWREVLGSCDSESLAYQSSVKK